MFLNIQQAQLLTFSQYKEGFSKIIHTCWFISHCSRWSTWVSWFPNLTFPLHTFSLTPSHHVVFREEKVQQWKKKSRGRVYSMSGNWYRDFVARCPSCYQPVIMISIGPHPFFNHWGKGLRFLLCLLPDIGTHNQNILHMGFFFQTSIRW